MDIAYCTNKTCPCKDCRRHLDNAPHFVPVTIAAFGETDAMPCSYYWPTPEPKE